MEHLFVLKLEEKNLGRSENSDLDFLQWTILLSSDRGLGLLYVKEPAVNWASDLGMYSWPSSVSTHFKINWSESVGLTFPLKKCS